ncbi:MAG: hypothetical protein GX591_06425 [Planctomycetes bacterium]|nr:hypothetical protein [Planctomycetota bacterium]
MARRRLHTNQPAIDAAGRATEGRPAWIGLLVAVAAVGVILAGALLVRRVPVGSTQRMLSEVRINAAATRGGLERVYAEASASDAAGQDGGRPADPDAAPVQPEPPSLQEEQKKADDDFCPT